MFEQTLLAAPDRGGQGMRFAASMGMQFLLVGAALMMPLYFTEVLPMARLNIPLPAPSMPKPIAVQLVEVPRAVAEAFRPMLQARFYAPRRIPATVPVIVDLPDGPPVLTSSGPAVRAGGGVIGSIGEPAAAARIDTPPPAKPVEAAAPKPAGPVKVSAGVQLAKLLKQVLPTYPPLARQARIQGTVRLVGVIAKDGRIINLQALSGHPLLVGAALDAVKQWIYRPTELNGEPVEVIAPIDVHFTLSQ